MNKLKIVADDRIPFLRGVFEPWCEVVYLPGAKITAADVADASALIVRTRTRCNRSLLQGSRVKIVATATIGFDHIASSDLQELGIKWINAPGCNAASVAQYMCAALLKFGDPAGRTLGVIGVGNVGRRVAEVGRTLGMKVLLNDPPRAEREGETGFVPLSTIRDEADFITLHVPLETGGRYPTLRMLDAEFFAGIKRGAVFFNTSRGEAAVGEEVKRALRSGQLSAVVSDVWEHEPGIDLELLKMAALATPHIAGYSTDGKANGTSAAVRAVARELGIPELTEWRVPELPPPPGGAEYRIATKEDYPALRDAVLFSYDPGRDDAALRAAPESFEALRGGYPVRREFPAFTVSGGSAAVRATLGGLGFRLG